MLWKTFLTCATAVFTIAFLGSILHGHSDWTPASYKFGKIRVAKITPTDVIPGAIILGVVSGLLGPFFINVNTRVNAFRAKIWTKKWHKPLDTFLFAFCTASCFYWVPYLFRSCVSRVILEKDLQIKLDLKLDQVVESQESQSVY